MFYFPNFLFKLGIMISVNVRGFPPLFLLNNVFFLSRNVTLRSSLVYNDAVFRIGELYAYIKIFLKFTVTKAREKLNYKLSPCFKYGDTNTEGI